MQRDSAQHSAEEGLLNAKKKGYVGIYLNFISFNHDLTDFSKPFLTKHGHVLIGCQGDLVYSGHTGLQLLPFTELLPEFSYNIFWPSVFHS